MNFIFRRLIKLQYVKQIIIKRNLNFQSRIKYIAYSHKIKVKHIQYLLYTVERQNYNLQSNMKALFQDYSDHNYLINFLDHRHTIIN